MQHDFTLQQFVDNVHLFGFIAGYQKRTCKEQDPVNIEATELTYKLHNNLKSILVKAHQQLDKAVDLCYRPQAFSNETKRIEFLFELYDQYTAGLFVGEKKGKKKKAL